jgi:hypothetical protein
MPGSPLPSLLTAGLPEVLAPRVTKLSDELASEFAAARLIRRLIEGPVLRDAAAAATAATLDAAAVAISAPAKVKSGTASWNTAAISQQSKSKTTKHNMSQPHCV